VMTDVIGLSRVISPCSYSQSLSDSKGSPYSTTERSVPELIPVLGSQPADDVSHKPDGRLSLLSTSDSTEFIGAIQINLSIYPSMTL